MKLVTCISKMSFMEMIIIHCRVVYQSNVLPVLQWTDYGCYGVVGRKEGGGGRTKSSRAKKKIRRNISEPPIFTSFLFLIKKWIPFRCASVQQDVTNAASTKRKHKMRSSFKAFFCCGSCDNVRVMLTSLTDFNNFPKLAKYQQNNV